MRVKLNRYKDGKKRALTMSYDDGNRADLRLLEIFNKYGIKGTFHLNSGRFSDWTVTPEEIKRCYVGHEISAHSLTHHFMECTPDEEIFYEVLEDRRRLEEICGHPVCGASYPQGTYTPALAEKVRMLGWRYCRTTHATKKVALPDDFVLWHPTCHHKDPDLMKYLEKLKTASRSLALLYVWGHSYEFDKDNNWEIIEEFCREAGGDPDIWYATNIEIYDYVTALHSLRFSVDRTLVQNPTATDVWISAASSYDSPAGSACIKVPAGALVNIAEEVKKHESEEK